MGVGEDDGRDAGGSDRQARPVSQPQSLIALEKAAIDQNTLIVLLQQIFGPGNRPGPTQESELQHIKTAKRKGQLSTPRRR